MKRDDAEIMLAPGFGRYTFEGVSLAAMKRYAFLLELALRGRRLVKAALDGRKDAV